jgi:hypothetical protein
VLRKALSDKEKRIQSLEMTLGAQLRERDDDGRMVTLSLEMTLGAQLRERDDDGEMGI